MLSTFTGILCNELEEYRPATGFIHTLIAKIASAGFCSLYLPDRISAFFRDDISNIVRTVPCNLCE